jgi:hypothetical protein
MDDRSAYRFGPSIRPAVFLAHQMRQVDAEFIAAARVALPALLDALDRIERLAYSRDTVTLTDALAIAEAIEPPTDLRSGPIEIEFDGDESYVWEYSTEANE